MKKTMFVVAIVAVLVFAFAATAMAASYLPNRSSAFLGSLSTATQQDEMAISAGGTKAAYISWNLAKTTVDNIDNVLASSANATPTQELMLRGPHNGYSMTTVKCQVCHSAHKAVYTGTKLTSSAGGGCVTCHGAASTFGFARVSAGNNLDQRHGGPSACTSYLCHTMSPHGAEVSIYPGAASAMLSDYIDAQLTAAIESGASDSVVTAGGPAATGELVWAEYKIESPNDVYGLGAGMYSSISVDIYQPAFDTSGATAALEDPQDADDITLARAVATGYTCANEGCHINGSFNGMSSGSYYGQWKFYNASGNYIDPATLTPGSLAADGIDLARRAPISGHALFSAITTDLVDSDATMVDDRVQTAWATSGTCRSCHDQVDPRLNAAAFPHSNSVWSAVESGAFETVDGQGYTRLYNTAAWFTLAANVGATKVNTTTRTIGTTASTIEPLTVAMDGACLKCHQNADGTSVGHEF